ncbi:hypothetical protein M5689_012471 [Euphorbia peplus]|nr:hypothetical protein M5689_012471 [Euphorbia peplus]
MFRLSRIMGFWMQSWALVGPPIPTYMTFASLQALIRCCSRLFNICIRFILTFAEDWLLSRGPFKQLLSRTRRLVDHQYSAELIRDRTQV